jgi:HEAT repeat protein
VNSCGDAKSEILSHLEDALSTGLAPRDVELLYTNSSIRVAILRRPINLKQGSPGAQAFETHNDFTIFETPDGDYRFYPHPKMVVQSDDLEWLEYKLDMQRWPLNKPSLGFPPDCQIVVRTGGGFVGSSLGMVGWRPQSFSGFGPPGSFQKPLTPRDSLFGLNFAAGQVNARISAEFSSAADATEYKSRFESGVATIRTLLSQRGQPADFDATEMEMLNAILASNVTTTGPMADVRFSFSGTDLTALGRDESASPLTLPSQKRRSKEPTLTVRVTGSAAATQDRLDEHVKALVGGTDHFRGYRFQDTSICTLKTTVTAEEFAKRVDFGEVKRVKGRGVLIAADPSRLAVLPTTEESKAKIAAAEKHDEPPKQQTVATLDSKTLLKNLSDPDRFKRGDAVKALTGLGPDENQPAIARHLDTLLMDSLQNRKESWLMTHLLDALEVWGDKDSVPTLIEALKRTRRTECLLILAKFPNDEVVDAMVEYLDRAPWPPEKELWRTLETMGPWGEKVALRVLKRGEAGRDATRLLAKFLRSYSQENLLPPESVATLLDLTRTISDRDTLRPVIEALATVKEARVADVLVTVLTNSRHAEDAKPALIAMGPIAENAVRNHLKHQEPTVRIACCEILAEIGTSASVASLRSLVANNPVGPAARAALKRINEREKQEN